MNHSTPALPIYVCRMNQFGSWLNSSTVHNIMCSFVGVDFWCWKFAFVILKWCCFDYQLARFMVSPHFGKSLQISLTSRLRHSASWSLPRQLVPGPWWVASTSPASVGTEVFECRNNSKQDTVASFLPSLFFKFLLQILAVGQCLHGLEPRKTGHKRSPNFIHIHCC